MSRLAVATVPLMLLLSVPAIAGDRIVIEQGARPSAFKSEVQVNVSVSFFAPAAVDDSEASVKAQQRARRMLYENASKECDLLRATIATDCRLQRININVRTKPGYGRQPAGLNATGNFSYRITLK